MIQRYFYAVLAGLLLLSSPYTRAQEDTTPSDNQAETVAEEEVAEPTGPTADDPLNFAGRSPQMRINLEQNAEVFDHFRVGPARQIIKLAPGETTTVDLSIFNLQGKDTLYQIETEDYAVDGDQEGAAKFYGSEVDGPFPARWWLKPEISSVPLRHGEKGFFRVKVEVPNDAEPGDHQAAVLVKEATETNLPGGFKVLSRVASMFIVTVEGDIIQAAKLLSIRAPINLNWSTPVALVLRGQNTGTVHAIPAGTVTIRNLFGAIVDEIPVQDWVLLRDSIRERHVTWEPKFALGYYRATTDLMFTSTVGQLEADQVSTSFWVIPIVPALIVLVAIFVVSFLVQLFFSRFEVRSKKSPTTDKGKK